MRRCIPALIAILALAFTAGAQDYDALYNDLPIALEKPAAPSIPDLTVSICSYGASGDGVTLCTEAFDRAIKDISKRGGGHIIIPSGIWLTGPIKLRSGIDLHLETGAIIQFTPDKRAYFDGDTQGRARPCISADKCTDISITGDGIIDGNGKYWRYAKREKLSDAEWKELKALGGTELQDGKLWFPSGLKHFRDMTDSPEKEEAIRQHMLVFKRCTRLLISGVTVQNSPKFHINPSQCTDVILDGVSVKCPWNAQNGDGIDIGNCQRVLVTRCRVDVGDDGICMKGGSGEKGLQAGACSDILICRNTVFRAHGGFVMGSDISGGMKRIVVQDCSFSGTDIGLRFKSAPGRGGHCEDIWIRRISMNDIRDAAISYSCDYSDITYKAGAKVEGVEFAPDFAGMDISGIICRECKTGIVAKGIPGLNCIHDIVISGSHFFYTGKGTDIDGGTASITIKDTEFTTYE